MGVEKINHQGKTIYYLDFRDMKSEAEILAKVQRCAREIRSQAPKSLLTLTDVGGMHFNNNIRDAFTDLSKGNSAFVKAGAVCGLSGLGSIVYNGLLKLAKRENIRSFKTIDEAKAYLIMQQ
jgi:hypothetical protein